MPRLASGLLIKKSTISQLQVMPTLTGRKVATKPLALDKSIAWIPRSLANRLLRISPRHMSRDIDVLQLLETEGFEYSSRKGFWRDSVEVLWQFRQLVEQLGRPEAIAIINEHMESFWNEHKR